MWDLSGQTSLLAVCLCETQPAVQTEWQPQTLLPGPQTQAGLHPSLAQLWYRQARPRPLDPLTHRLHRLLPHLHPRLPRLQVTPPTSLKRLLGYIMRNVLRGQGKIRILDEIFYIYGYFSFFNHPRFSEWISFQLFGLGKLENYLFLWRTKTC